MVHLLNHGHSHASPKHTLKGNYVFARPSQAVSQWKLHASKTPDELWSPKPPPGKKNNASARPRHLVSSALTGGFEAGPSAAANATAAAPLCRALARSDGAAAAAVSALESPEHCTICMDAIRENERVLACHKCSMRAHSNCLRKWFRLTPHTINGSRAKMLRRDGLVHTSVGCPGCRTPLDWDALALNADVSLRRSEPAMRGLLESGALSSRICLN